MSGVCSGSMTTRYDALLCCLLLGVGLLFVWEAVKWFRDQLRCRRERRLLARGFEVIRQRDDP